MSIMVGLEDLPEIKKRYEKAMKENRDTFMYNYVPVMVSYAKYLIEYLESLKDKK